MNFCTGETELIKGYLNGCQFNSLSFTLRRVCLLQINDAN